MLQKSGHTLSIFSIPFSAMSYEMRSMYSVPHGCSLGVCFNALPVLFVYIVKEAWYQTTLEEEVCHDYLASATSFWRPKPSAAYRSLLRFGPFGQVLADRATYASPPLLTHLFYGQVQSWISKSRESQLKA